MTTNTEDPVIFELGSYSLKGGVKSSDKPSVVLKSVYSGTKAYPEFENEQSHIETFPIINNGLVVDWDTFSPFIQSAYQKMGISEIQDRPVVIALHPQRSRDNVYRLITEMFETLQVPALYIALKPHMNLYGSGHLTGLSVVLGHDVTSWMPIYEGYCINNAIGSNYLAGSMITKRLKNLIQRNNEGITNNRVLDSIKEKCYIVQNYEAEYQLQKAESQKFTLPHNNSEISLQKELFSAPEILFKPQLEGLDYYGIHYTIHDAIINSPMDTRKDLHSNIILGGGTAVIPGFSERLKDDLNDLDPELFVKTGIHIQKPDNIWKGCQILCDRPKFNETIASKKEYEEKGPVCVRFPII